GCWSAETLRTRDASAEARPTSGWGFERSRCGAPPAPESVHRAPALRCASRSPPFPGLRRERGARSRSPVEPRSTGCAPSRSLGGLAQLSRDLPVDWQRSPGDLLRRLGKEKADDLGERL